ncbi:hypothetical protein RSAG8_02977, partial [Rhizoctonia solani AG-8 WAC10335]
MHTNILTFGDLSSMSLFSYLNWSDSTGTIDEELVTPL